MMIGLRTLARAWMDLNKKLETPEWEISNCPFCVHSDLCCHRCLLAKWLEIPLDKNSASWCWDHFLLETIDPEGRIDWSNEEEFERHSWDCLNLAYAVCEYLGDGRRRIEIGGHQDWPGPGD